MEIEEISVIILYLMGCHGDNNQVQIIFWHASSVALYNNSFDCKTNTRLMETMHIFTDFFLSPECTILFVSTSDEAKISTQLLLI